LDFNGIAKESQGNAWRVEARTSDAFTAVHTLRLGGCSTGWGLNDRTSGVDSVSTPIVSQAESLGRLVFDVQHRERMLPRDRRVRVVVQGVSPEFECGGLFTKRKIGDFLTVEADISTDDHV
jgi:hypothetical protein